MDTAVNAKESKEQLVAKNLEPENSSPESWDNMLIMQKSVQILRTPLPFSLSLLLFGTVLSNCNQESKMIWVKNCSW